MPFLCARGVGIAHRQGWCIFLICRQLEEIRSLNSKELLFLLEWTRRAEIDFLDMNCKLTPSVNLLLSPLASQHFVHAVLVVFME